MTTEQEQVPEEEEISLLDGLIVLLKHKKFIFYATFGVALLTAIISLIMPPVYEAKTSILSPQQNTSSMAQFLGNSALASMGMGAGLLEIKNPNDIYIELLKSRSVLDNVIDRLDLLKRYGTKSHYAARQHLLSELKTHNDIKSGILTIMVESKDPKEAADIANAFVGALENKNNSLAITAASQKRLFFQEQLNDAKASLLKAEDAMKAFQQKAGLLQVDDQGKAELEAIAGIRAQIAAKEVEIRVMRTYSTALNPNLETDEEELNGLRAEASKFSGKMPAVQADYSNKLMALMFDQKLYGLLQSQYEAAKLDEAGDPSIIQVIDKAVPPEKREKPKRSVMVVISLIMAFVFSVIASFLIEYMKKLSADPENRDKFATIKKYVSVRFGKWGRT